MNITHLTIINESDSDPEIIIPLEQFKKLVISDEIVLLHDDRISKIFDYYYINSIKKKFFRCLDYTDKKTGETMVKLYNEKNDPRHDYKGEI